MNRRTGRSSRGQHRALSTSTAYTSNKKIYTRVAGLAAMCLAATSLNVGVAAAADATKAVWSGTGTYTDPVTGQIYGKGGPATLTVTTSPDTKCASVNPSWQNGQPIQQTSAAAKTLWTFPLNVPTTGGTFSATASASPSFNGSGGCTGSTPGNASVTASYIVDNGLPLVTGVATPVANGAGWNNSNVSIAWSATDTGSGIKSGPTPPSDTVTSDSASSAGTTKSSTATDNVGNVGTGSLVVRLDKTLPTISPTRNPAPNALGWNNTDVTVGFSCSDVLSGIKSCSGGAPVVVSTEGTNQAVAGEAVDVADNKNGAGVTGINIDKTKPTLSGAPTTAANTDGWYKNDVAIAWTANDDRSGVVATPANSTISGEGSGLFASETVSDKAGNSAAADSAKVNIDRTAPTTDATVPQAWTNQNQTITLVPKDGLAGVKSTHYKLDGGTPQAGTIVSISGDGIHTLEYWSLDKAGNQEQPKTVQVKIDGTSPTIGFTKSPAANVNGWHSSNVTVKFQCADDTSGIASCTPDQVVSTEAKDQPVKGTATDNAGNSVSATAHVSLDKTAPTIAAAADRAPNTSSAANGTGWYKDDVDVTFTCGDSLSGIASCPATKTLSEGYDQSASGTAADAAGNTASAGVAKINIDKTPATLSGKPSATANTAGWYSGDVTIDWTCADALSGVAEGACPASSPLTGEGDNLGASASVADRAGNIKSASVSGIKIDRHVPSTVLTDAATLNGLWVKGPINVALTASDSLSRVATTYYSVDGGTAKVYADAFTFNEGGTHTLDFWSVDNAGNAEPKNTVTLKIDDVKPSITGSRSPALSTSGWDNAPVTVSFACTDAQSGIASCLADGSADHTLKVDSETTSEGVTVGGTATDNVGNAADATVGPIKVDLTKPTLSGSPTTPDNGLGWYKGNVTVKWTGLDGLSGIASQPTDTILTGEGTGLKAGPQTVKDVAGNESLAAYSPAVNIDRTAPTISGKTVNDDGTARAANTDTWFNSAVRVRFACADSLSTIQECASDVVLDKDGANLSATGKATDKADNAAEATVGGINLDSLPPKSDSNITCNEKNGFCRGNKATVTFTASDPAPAGTTGVTTSGVKLIQYKVNGAATQTGTSTDVPLNGSGQATVTFWAIDKAGNKETDNTVTIDYDTIAPTVTHTLTPAWNGARWSRQDTTVKFTATDDPGGSNVDPATATKEVLVDQETAGQLVSHTAYDNAGNDATDSVTVMLDKTKPTITANLPAADGANGWHTKAVALSFTCADPKAANGAAGSGIATCSPQQVLDNGQSFVGKAEDKADNTAEVTAGPVKVDGDAPTVVVNGIANGGVYFLGKVPPATCTATDVGPAGIDGSCAVNVTGGQPNGVGTFTYTATAKDRAGNVTNVTGSYAVRYGVTYSTSFWLQPINDTAHTTGTTTSVFKAGSTVPAKFRLVDASGKAIQTNTAPIWINPVRGSATTASVDEPVYSDPADSGSFFKWSSLDQHYQFNWSSPKNGAGFYWRIGVKLDDGTIQAVNIGLR